MLSPTLVHLSDDEILQHNLILNEILVNFGNLLIPTMAILNKVQGPGQSLAQVIAQFQMISSLFLFQSEQKINSAHDSTNTEINRALLSRFAQLQLSASDYKKNFYLSLNERIAKSFTLLSYLICTVESLEDDSKLLTDKSFRECMAYCALLSAVLAFNCTLVEMKYLKDTTNISALINTYHKWLHCYEVFFQDVRHHDAILGLKQRLLTQVKLFENQVLPQLEHSLLSIEALKALVESKNKRAQQYGTHFNAIVLQNSDTTCLESVDPRLAKQINAVIQELTTSKNPGRKQVILYTNTEYGHVEGLDLMFDPQSQTLTIFNISPTNSALQHSLLQHIQVQELTVKTQIIACSANLRNKPYTEAQTVYALLSLSSRLNPDEFMQMATQNQPHFFDASKPKQPRAYPKLDDVRWFPLGALGDKCFLLNNDESTVKKLFHEHYSPSQAQQRLDFYQKKYGTLCYSDYFTKELQRRQLGKGLSTESIMQKLETHDLGLALRKAAAGYCTRSEFNQLLKHVCQTNKAKDFLDSYGLQSGFTPLMRSLENNRPSRTIALLNAGCDPKAPDSKNNAKKLYDELPDNSLSKRNGVLRKYFSD